VRLDFIADIRVKGQADIVSVHAAQYEQVVVVSSHVHFQKEVATMVWERGGGQRRGPKIVEKGSLFAAINGYASVEIGAERMLTEEECGYIINGGDGHSLGTSHTITLPVFKSIFMKMASALALIRKHPTLMRMWKNREIMMVDDATALRLLEEGNSMTRVRVVPNGDKNSTAKDKGSHEGGDVGASGGDASDDGCMEDGGSTTTACGVVVSLKVNGRLVTSGFQTSFINFVSSIL
jgi:hypothetical protein